MTVDAWVKVHAPRIITSPVLYKSADGDILITKDGFAIGEIKKMQNKEA